MAIGLNIHGFREKLENKIFTDSLKFNKRIYPLNIFMTDIENLTNDVWDTMLPGVNESFDESNWHCVINIDSCLRMLIDMDVHTDDIEIRLDLIHMDEFIIDNVKCHIVGDHLVCDEKLDISDNERIKATTDPEVFELLQKALNTIEVK